MNILCFAYLTVIRWSHAYKETSKISLTYPKGSNFDFDINEFKKCIKENFDIELDDVRARLFQYDLIEYGVINFERTIDNEFFQFFLILDKT